MASLDGNFPRLGVDKDTLAGPLLPKAGKADRAGPCLEPQDDLVQPQLYAVTIMENAGSRPVKWCKSASSC